jgi:hypothetical protein
VGGPGRPRAPAPPPAPPPALGGAREGHPAAPLNAVSHIVWGDRAAERAAPSAKYTATGAALNGVAVTGWALLHAALFRRGSPRRGLLRALAGGATIAALAWVVDYHVVPRRLSPGFEARLSNRDLLAVYAVLALCFAYGGRQRDAV